MRTAEALDLAAADLRRRLEAAGAAPRSAWLSRFGLDFVEGAPESAWPSASIPGLREVRGPGSGRVELRRVGAEAVLAFEWESDPRQPATPADEAFLVWLAHRLGVAATVHVAAGLALWPVPDGTVLPVRDHLRFGPGDPLAGAPFLPEGARHPQLQDLYDPELLRAATAELCRVHPSLRPAVALVRSGPSGPTPAELAAFRALGADVVVEAGSSEGIAARHCGLRHAALVAVLGAAGEPVDPGRFARRAEQGLPLLATLLRRLAAAAAPESSA